jgi:PST family polysaccharide transporter/lipopolysaccharide exporter
MKDRLRALLVRFTPTGSVLEQTVKSGAWMGAMNVSGRALQLVMVIILANLLNPVEFGLLGIGLLILSGLNKFSKLGLNAAVIHQKEENVDEYMDTMWVLQLVRGGLLAGILLLLAPVIGSVFGEPQAIPVVRALALSPVLIALRNPAVVYFQKRLDFHMEFAYQMGGSLTRFVVSIGWAFVSPSVWALVVGLLASEFVKLVISYVALDYRPWPVPELEYAVELVDYGKWITANSILYFLYSEGDDAIVGWLLSATALGFYQTAYRLSNAPATEVTQVISSVMFPAFSNLQGNMEAMREAYYRMLQMTMLVACPAAFGIAAVADVFVPTFMGQEWTPMVTVLQLLAAYGLMRSVGKTMGPLWKAIGRPDYVAKLSALRVALIAILIVPATNAYGIEGTALLITGVYVFPMFPLDAYVVINSIEGSYRRFFTEIAYPLVASVIMFGAVVTVHQASPLGTGVLEFALLVVVGAAVYTAVVGLFAFQLDWGIEKNMKSLLGAVT